MFREHRGSSNVFPQGSQVGGEAADIPGKKSKKPVFRTLEPRMVFDAAAAVAAEQAAQAPARHEPVADTGQHTELAAPAWNHLEAALKAAPVTPVDKPTPTGGPALAPVEPVAADKAVGGTNGVEAPATIAGTGVPGIAEQAPATDEKVVTRAEPTGIPEARGDAAAIVSGAADKTQTPPHADIAGGTDHPQAHLPEALEAAPLSPPDTSDRSGAIDPPDPRSQAHEAAIVAAAVPAERLEARTSAVPVELALKGAAEPTHADATGKANQPSTVEATPDTPSDAARPGTAVGAAREHDLPAASDRVVTDPRAGTATNVDARSVDVTAAAGVTSSAPTEVFFIWNNVTNWQQIVASLGVDARVYVLDASKDGVEQIAGILKGQSNIGALHIISHGSEGSLTLGTAVLDAESMQGEYRDELETIGQALSQNGDILIYGCDFAAGADGLQAATILSGITHADVAASTDPTGAAARGGDWTLEEHTGAIETRVFADYDYQFLLANPAVDLNGAQIGGNTTVGYIEQAAPASIVATGAADGATATDTDNDLQSITIVANAAPNGNSEHLTFGGTAVGLGSDSITTVTVAGTTYSILYTASTRTFVITNSAGGNIPSGGATNALVRSITYDNGSDNPTNGGLNANRIFTFTATDAAGGSSAGRTATVNITAVNDNPVDGNETRTVTEDVTLSAPAASGLLANASDPDGNPLTIASYTIAGVPGTQTVGSAVAIAGVGTITINTDGSYSFAPTANFNGTIPVITYTVSDGAGGTDTSTLTLTMAAVNDAPAGTDNTVTLGEDAAYTFSAASFGFTDPGDTPANGFQAVIITTLPPAAQGTLLLSGVAVTAGQTIALADIPNLTFQPAANVNGNGVGSFTFQVVDDGGTANGGQNTDQSPNNFAFNITAANDAPAGTDNTATITEDTSYTFTAASFGFADPNDSPANGFQAVIITTLPPVAQGTLLLSGIAVTAGQTIAVADIPNLTFQPAADVNGNGVGSFTFQVVDDGGTANGGQNTDQSPNTFSFNITAVNDAPVANDDTTTTPEDTTLNGNVLANDADVDGDTMTVTQFSALNVTAVAGQTGTIPGVGQITINADGAYTFVPVADFNGPVPTITYTISDGHGGTDTATLNITVIPVNDPPIDGNETNTVVEDTTLTVADGASGDLLNNASDSDGGTVTITDYTVPGVNGGNPITAGTATLIPGVGTITINANGSYSFAPAANYDGPIPVITYTVSDGQGGTDTSTLTLTMTPVNDAPVATDDATTTPENTPVSGNVLTNDTDVDSTNLTVTFFTIDGTTYGAGTTAAIPGVGTLVINTDGSYTFTPAPNYDGPVPTATYTVSDGQLTDTAILTIIITPENDPPVATDDTGTTPEDTTLTGNVLTNDTDVDGDALSVTQFVVDGATYTAGQAATIAGVGDLTINADGSYTFVPAPNYNGPVPVATYTVSDGNGGTDQGTLTLNVTPVNDPPVAVDDTGTTPEDTPLSGNVLGNDTDPDTGDTLTVVGFTVNGITFIAGATTTVPEGTITVNADGSYTLVPAANYTGPVPVITYTVEDENGTRTTATLTLNVTPVNDPPVANDDNASTPEDTTLSGNVINNDNDVDGDTIIVTEYTIPGVNGGNPIPAGTTTPIPGVGTITINPDGSYIFVPAPGYDGPVPEIDYTISDGNGGTDQGALNIDVIPPGGAGANDDVATTPEDTTLTGNVVSNDVNPAGGTITVTSFTVAGDPTVYAAGSPAAITGVGTLTINADGTYTFVPAPDYFGPVPVVTYTATNGTASDTATLTITVTPVNDPPIAVDDTGTTPEDTTLTGNVLTNDTDIDNATLTVTQFSVNGITATAGQTGTIPDVGQITVNANGSYTFVPAPDYNGLVPVITYTVSDGTLTDTATLTITVTPVNDPPVAVNDTGTTPEDTTLTVPAASGLLFNDSDVDGTPLTVTGFQVGSRTFTAGQTATIPLVGQLTINADGSYTFVPAPNYNGPVPVVTYTVSDGALTDTATLTITVTPVNDVPVANDDTATLAEDTTLTVPAASGLLANDSDVDNATLTVEGFEVEGVLFGPGTTANIPGFGALMIAADGSYTFTPALNFNGTVPPVTYRVSDGSGGTASAVLTITVTPVNDPPVDGNETNTVVEDTTLSVPAANGLLNNATDVDGIDTLTIADYAIPGINGGNPIAAGTATLIPGVGTITINADGSYTFAPAADYTGAIPVITYTVSDNAGGTDTSTLTLTITPVNDPPVARNDLVSTPEDTTLTGNVLGNDVDVDGDPLTVDLYEVAGVGGFLPGAPAVIPNVGTLTINADGSYTFVPLPNYNGPVPVATYRIHDPSGFQSSADLIIFVTPVNDPPVDDNETNTVTEDTPLTVPTASGLLANTTDIDGGTPSVIGYTVDGLTGTIGTGHLIAGVGTITINADGSYSFVPVANYAGPIPVVTYTVSDNAGGTDTSTLTLTMIPVNDPPAGADKTVTIAEDTAYAFSAGDFGFTDPNDNPANALQAVIITTLPPASDGTLLLNGVAVTVGQTIAVADIPNLTFQPAANVNGIGIGVFTFQVVDNGGTANGGQNTDQSPNRFAFNIAPVNDPPVDGNETNTVVEDTTLTVASGTVDNLLNNATDVEGDTLTITSYTIAGMAGTQSVGGPVVIAGVGTITINADGSYSFAPAADYTGPIPVITYTVSDGQGGTDTSTLTLTITPVNDPPVAVDDAGTTPEDTTLTGNVLTNDSDVDGDALSVTQFVVDGTTYTAGQTATIVGVGALTIGADGSYSFVPVANYNGPVPVATYTISDGALVDTATLTITVTPVNDPPVAVDDAGTTPEDTTLTGNVLVNDTDVDGDPLSVTQFVVDGATYTAGQTATIVGVGALTIGADGSYSFVPVANYNGPVPVATYTISDGALVDTATLTITVTPVNDPPVAVDDAGTTPEDTTLTGNVLTNDTDVDGDSLSVTQFVVDGTTYTAGQTATIAGVGALTIGADGSYSFVPAANYNGPVPVATYTISDGALVDTATLTITVTPVNDPPVAVDDAGTTPEDTTLTGNVLTNDTDVDGGPLSVTQFVVDGTTYTAGQTATIAGVGALTIGADGSYSFVPVANYNGPVPVATYTISDGALVDTATLTITVTPV
ncbi:Ig-like domain-containing protein, partial [Bosea sp. NPDC055353]